MLFFVLYCSVTACTWLEKDNVLSLLSYWCTIDSLTGIKLEGLALYEGIIILTLKISLTIERKYWAGVNDISCGAMVARLTSNQKAAGSSPASGMYLSSWISWLFVFPFSSFRISTTITTGTSVCYVWWGWCVVLLLLFIFREDEDELLWGTLLITNTLPIL